MLGRLARDRRPLEARVLGFSFDCRQQLLDLGVCNEKVQLLDDLLAGSRGMVYAAGSVFRHEAYSARSLRKAADVTLADVALQYDPGFEVE